MLLEIVHDGLRATLRQHLIVLFGSGAVGVAAYLDHHFRIFLERGDTVVQGRLRIGQHDGRVGCEMHAFQFDLVFDGAPDRIDPVTLGSIRTLIDRIRYAIAIAVGRWWWW